MFNADRRKVDDFPAGGVPGRPAKPDEKRCLATSLHLQVPIDRRTSRDRRASILLWNASAHKIKAQRAEHPPRVIICLGWK